MPNLQERLNNYTYVQDGHLLWGGSSNYKGYGLIAVGNRKMMSTHRLAWQIAYGNIPKKLWVLHRCNTPPCILPWHLYLGTHTDNMQDRMRQGNIYNTNKTHCIHKHTFSKQNTSITPNGRRQCRTCGRIRTQTFKEKQLGSK